MPQENTGQSIVRCLQIPVNGGYLLLPNSVIAEVMRYSHPSNLRGTTVPEWLLGTIQWRNQQVPVIDIEELLSLPAVQSDRKRYRTIILYGLEAPQSLPFYAFTTIDIPRTLNVTEKLLGNPLHEKRRNIMFTTQTTEQENIWYPDLTHLENLLRKAQIKN